MVYYSFDGSFEGLLTAIFDMYDYRHSVASIHPVAVFQPPLLAESHRVDTSKEKAARVWAGLQKKLSPRAQTMLYRAFLSEDPAIHLQCLLYAQYIFNSGPGAENNFGHPAVMAVAGADKKVNRERHRMKAFIRFTLTADGIYYAAIEPDFNVLPLIITFFRDRYADQRWIIYDVKRRYGIMYDLQKISEVVYEETPALAAHNKAVAAAPDASDALASLLWKDYFRSTNITQRKNMKLHIRHVPKRYWKYLDEKQPFQDK